MTQQEFIGLLVIGLGSLLLIIKYFTDYQSQRHSSDDAIRKEFNEKFTETANNFSSMTNTFMNTINDLKLTLEQTRSTLKALQVSMETQEKYNRERLEGIEKRLNDHEGRLDKQHEAIIKLSNYKDINITGGKE